MVQVNYGAKGPPTMEQEEETTKLGPQVPKMKKKHQ